MINAIIKEPGKRPKFIKLEGTLQELQKLVGGKIECIYELDEKGITIWCNDESKLSQDSKPNFWIYERQDIVYGTAIFVGFGEEGEDISLTDEQSRDIFDYLKVNEPTIAEQLTLQLIK
ncbi:MAG: DUF3846 domain-containing protein [Oscillospiraceae bacterium]